MIPLHVRSHYSFLRGSSPVAELVDRAVELGLPALGLADDANACGAVEFWTAAKAAGLAPILGAAVDGMVLLARNRNGWSNLCALLSRHHLGRDLELGRHQEDLHVLVEDPARARALRGVVDRLWLELVRPARSATAERDALLSGLPLVASSDAHFARPEGHRAHRVLSAIRANATLEGLGPTCDPGHHLRDLRPLFADCPGALANAERIAADCAWSFLPAPTVFPSYDLPPGESAAGLLRSRCEAGMRRRYGTPTAAAEARLARELGVIGRLGFAEYFLVVHDIVGEARAQGAPVAGRGSGASSLVAYVLGLTNVCPLRYGLQFERFLHEGRADWPDLDLDFCWRTRDGLIDYAFERFGRDRVAMVSTVITVQERGAFREAAKAHGLSDGQIRAVRRVLPPDAADSLDARFRSPRSPVEPGRLGEILADARRILGAPQHLSVHPGGIVVSPGPLDRITPLQRAEKGVVISQFDKDGVEAAGLVKIDLLGNRAVSTIRAAVDLVAAEGERIDVESLPDDDPAVAALLSEGRTIGVNQLESPAMRHLLRMTRARGVADVMQALALVRPGAAGDGMKDAFVRRRRGLEAWSVDPRLEGVLGAAHGVLLYEDDLMLVVAALTGCPLAEADRVRRRIQKAATEEERRAVGREFGARCAAAGTPLESARAAWRQMAKFTGYTFCMSHAASYARLAVTAAWLKAHRPVAFWTAALNNNQGMYERRVYVEEARRGGVETRGPCVNASEAEFTAEGGALRIGLGQVAGLSARAVASIRAERPFASLQEFLRRAETDAPEREALAKCGALDVLGRPRSELLLELAATSRLLRSGRDARRVEIPRIPEVEERRKRVWELELLGMCPGSHPLPVLAAGLDRRGLARSSELVNRVGERVRVAGVLDALRVTETQGGGRMEFLTFEDEDGVFEATVWPSSYRRIAAVVQGAGPYVVTGKVEEHHDVVTVAVEGVEEALSLGP